MRFGSKKAVSPVLAELLLMFVSLLTALLVGSFGFQTIGTASRPAEVSAQLDSCAAAGTNETCSVTLANIGTSNIQTLSSCGMGSDGGNLISGGTVPAGGTLAVSCFVTGLPYAGTGIPITGWVALSNGADVYFAGSS